MKRVFCGLVALSLYLAAAHHARAGFIYWSNTMGGDIRRANLDGTEQTTLVTGQSRPIGPALDLAGGQMYWGNIGGDLRRANLDGTGQTTLVAGLGGGGVALDLAGSRMYWNNSVSGNLHRANLDGTGVTTLVTGQNDPHAGRLDLASGQMYWTEFGAGTIRRANLDGTGLTTLIAGLPQPNLLDLDIAAGNIYWTNRGSGDIRRAKLDGSGQQVLVQNLNYPSGITLDVGAGKMYWANLNSGDIQRANLDGSGQETLFTGLPGPVFIALDLISPPEHGTWNVDSAGNWSMTDNWLGPVPNAPGKRAVLASAIQAPRTVTLDVAVTLGRVDFGGQYAYTIAGADRLTLDVASGNAQINVTGGSVTGGSHMISAPVTLADNTVISVSSAASTLSISGSVSAAGVNVAKSGAGTLAMSRIDASGLAINAGKVQLISSAGADEAGPWVLRTLAIAGGAAPTATLDLTSGSTVIDYTGTSPTATIRQQITAGRGGDGLGKGWNGMGITSSSAAAANATDPESHSVGYADNATLPLGPYTTFRGQAVDGTSILMAFTRTGDANLDGFVNDDDVTILGATYAPGVSQPSWAMGDFDYNGSVDDDDVTLLGAFYDPSAAPLAVPLAGSVEAVAAVPEPQTLVLAALGGFLVAVACGRRIGPRWLEATAMRVRGPKKSFKLTKKFFTTFDFRLNEERHFHKGIVR
jgi:hypothetical protein